jgi:phage shock protein A
VASRTIKSLHKSGRVSRSKARAAFEEIRSKILKRKRSAKASNPRATHLEGKGSVLKFRAEKWFRDADAVVLIPKKR